MVNPRPWTGCRSVAGGDCGGGREYAMELVEVGGVDEALAAVDAIEDCADHAQDDSTQSDSRTMRRDRGRPAIDRAPGGLCHWCRPKASVEPGIPRDMTFCTLAWTFLYARGSHFPGKKLLSKKR